MAAVGRITRAADYTAVMKRGKWLGAGSLRACFLYTDKPATRLGFAISKRQVARAVHRNRIKRHGKATIAGYADQLQGMDIVISATRPAATANRRELNADYQRLWRRLINANEQQMLEGGQQA